MHISVKRLSDNGEKKFEVEEHTKVGELKKKIRAEFAPHFPNGCRLIHNGKVLKSIHRLKHYKIGHDAVVDMDDRKNWSSSSSSSTNLSSSSSHSFLSDLVDDTNSRQLSGKYSSRARNNSVDSSHPNATI